MEEIFTPDAVYIESWGPEWKSRATVLCWDIKGFLHGEGVTMVEWYFQNVQDGGSPEAFDGVTLIHWSPEGKIARLQEFGCDLDRYDPYRDGPEPKFREEKAAWF